MQAVTSTMVEQNPLLELTGVRKTYGGVTALKGVDISLYAGEIHAICGENGAGKSTFMKIIAGAERPDSGTYEIGYQTVEFRSVSDANARGVSIVFQELSLFPEFDAVENVFLGREPTRLGLIDRAQMERDVAPLFELLGLSIDLHQPIGGLRIADQQLIEIAKALALDSQVLILDEPNSALNVEESERLFHVVRQLRAEGRGLFYISHRLEEVIALADRVSVLRNGLKVAELDASQMSVARIVDEMLGEKARDVTNRSQRTIKSVGDAPELKSLHFKDVHTHGVLRDCTFSLGPGEVVGLAGLEGSGCEEVLDLLFGRTSPTAGTINFAGETAPKSVRQAVEAGIALVPADRRTEGLSLGQDILGNLNMVVAGALGTLGQTPTRGQMTSVAQGQALAMNLHHGGFEKAAHSLSGGNQQKIVLGKWLASDPKLVLLNDPTRGVDVGAKDEIYSIIDKLAEEGRMVLFTSSELTEYCLVCHRVLLFYEGHIIGLLPGSEASEHTILEAINIGRLQTAT